MRRPKERSRALVLSMAMAGALAIGAHDAVAQDLPDGPSFRDVLSLKSVGGPSISPEGSMIAYTVSSTDWEDNRYDTEIWLARDGETPFQLTRTAEGSSTGPEWSPDGEWIAFAASRDGGRQIYVISPHGGEAVKLTAVDGGVGGYEWSPDGHHMAITLTEPEDQDRKTRDETYGAWEVEDAEYRLTHLWLLDVKAALASDEGATRPAEDKDAEDEDDAGNGTESEKGSMDEGEPAALRRLTGGDEFTVGGYAWSPDGATIAVDHRPDPLINSFSKTDLSLLDVASGELTPLVSRDGYDGGAVWSPDGSWILFRTDAEDPRYYTPGQMALVSPTSREIIALPQTAEYSIGDVNWPSQGIRFTSWQRTETKLFSLDPESGAIELVADVPRNIFGLDYSADGSQVALTAATPLTRPEIYRTSTAAWDPRPVTNMTAQLEGWPLGTREVIEWASEDGTMIEGVLFKPEGFDSSRAYPLLVVIHGGPSGIDYPVPVESYVYPVNQWLAKGAVVFQPNYRGSTGYGAEFLGLNYRNLGVGDAWDVESGVQHLIDQGIAHPDSIGAMGWSQGGYISAFLTTTSDRYRAISVGAGISDWMTYYVNTDIHPFTRHYLGADPWEDPEIYAVTSPITYIKDAKTPTLIQHGENDQRVPIPNAYELYQGLQDVGVEAKLVVYKNFGHGITRPKERLAAVWHNWEWFARHIWGDDIEMPND